MRGVVRDLRVGDLFYAVRIEKIAGNIDDRTPLEEHLHAPVIRNDGNGRRRKIFTRGEADKFVPVLFRNDDRHALLRLGDGEFRTRQPLVFERHFVEVDDQPVRKLADGDGNAARAEVVAFFDLSRYFRVEEQALQFALGERVALLHLCAAGLHRMRVVRFRRTGRAAASVAPRLSAEQDDDVALCGLLAVDHIPPGSADDEARFQPLRLVTGMIDLVDDARGEPYLIAVGREARRRRLCNDALRQFAGERILQLFARVCAARDAHRLIHICTSGERVADGAAQAGRRAAERLDLRRMVVRLVLEHDEIFFRLAVDLRVDADGAGVDLVGNVEVVEPPLFFQLFDRDGRNIHQTGIFILARGIELRKEVFIEIVCLSDMRVVGADLHIAYLRGKGGVAAVIRPIGIYDLDFGFRGVPALFAEIIAHENEVFHAHRKAVFLMVRGDLFHRHIRKARHFRHVVRIHLCAGESLGLPEGNFCAFDGIDEVFFDLFEFSVGDALHADDAGALDERARLLRE